MKFQKRDLYKLELKILDSKGKRKKIKGKGGK